MSAAPTHPSPTGITIDGSQHEGGGQIVRNAVALAAIAGVPIRVTAIRAGRPKPGLRPQHVAGVRLVAALSARSALAGCEVGSTELDFVPGRLALRPAQAADAGTAGSTMLMAQTALPALALAGPPAAGAGAAAADAGPGGGRGGGDGVDPGASVLLTLQGGTDAAMAPPADYAAEVLLPTLARAAGLRVCMAVTRRGFYPRGGGRVELTVTPLRPGATLPPLVLQRAGLGDVLTSVTILTSCAGRVTPAAVAAGAAALEAELRARWAAAAAGPGAPPPPPTPTITTRPSRSHAAPASGDGGSLTAIGCTVSGLLFGASAPLTPRDDPAAVGARLAGELADDVACPDASVDRWMGDQLVVWAALAGGGDSGASRWTTSAPPTPHARAAAAVATGITGCACRSHPPTQPGEGWGMEIHGAGVRAGGGGG